MQRDFHHGLLDQAPPGVFDGRSWAYWHLTLKGRRRPPPLPERRFPDDGRQR